MAAMRTGRGFDDLGGTATACKPIVVFARSMDDLVTWTSPRPLNPGAEADSVDDTAPAVSLAGNTLVAVWSSANTLQATMKLVLQ